MVKLRRAVQNFNTGKNDAVKLQALLKIFDLVAPGYYGNVESTEPSRKSFVKILKKDLEVTVNNLCSLTAEHYDPEDPDTEKVVHILLATLYFINLAFPGVRFSGRLIENRFIHILLNIAPELKDEKCIYWALVLLCRVVGCDFASSAYAEQGVYVRGLIFSKLDSLMDLRERTPNCKISMATLLFDIFVIYLMSENQKYYKSIVMRLVKDGIIKRMAELFMDYVSRDPEIAEKYINNMIRSYQCIENCVHNTAFESNQNEVELRLLHPLAIKHLSTVIHKDSHDEYGIALQNTVHLLIRTIASKPEDEIIQLYFDKKVFKQLASAFVSTLRTSKDYHLLTAMLQGLSSFTSAPQFKKYTKLKDIRVLLPYLPELVDLKKHPAAPPQFFKSCLTLASKIIVSSDLLKEMHFAELKDLNILTAFVETLKSLDGGKHPFNETLSLCMMMYCVAEEDSTCYRLSLREIDQILPAVPYLIKILTGKGGPPLDAHGVDTRPKSAHSICFAIIQNLLRIKEDKTSCIKKQLNTLQQYHFLSGICEAAILTEDLSVVSGLMDILDESIRLFDGREYIESLVSFLPRLVEKQIRYHESSDSNREEKEDFMGDCSHIVVKAAAYALDQLEPTFVRTEVSVQLMAYWLYFRVSGRKMFFSTDILNMEDALTEDEDEREGFFVDVLRATWSLNRLYPNIIKSNMPRYMKCSAESGDINKLTSSRIVGTIISYLDHSQEKSLVFLTELTAFVKDLADDTYIFDEEKLLFQDLAHACERFMMVNSNRVCIENLQYFIDNFEKSVNVDGILLD